MTRVQLTNFRLIDTKKLECFCSSLPISVTKDREGIRSSMGGEELVLATMFAQV